MVGLGCSWLGVLTNWTMFCLLKDEGGQVSRVIWISSEVLVDDIGLPVPVVQGALGILSDDSIFSREVFHDSWWCFSCWLWLGALPVKFGVCIPVGAGGFGVSLLKFCDGA